MLRTRAYLQFVCAILLAFTLSNCKKNYKAADLPDDIGQYVYGFTSGTISKSADIKVQFVGAAATAEQIGGEVPKSLFSIKPRVAGKAVWQDAQTLVFKPEKPLASGQNYVATIALKEVYSEVPASMEQFQFDFLVRQQRMNVSFRGLTTIEPDNLTSQQLRGYITTADVADEEAIKKTLTAKQNGKNLPIEWTHQSSSNKHEFSVRNIKRTKKRSEISLSWNGSPIGADSKDKRTIEVLPLGEFKVTNAQAISEGKPFFLLLFSDPLDESQQLNGLIRIENYTGKLNFDIDKNEVKVYPKGKMAGNYEIIASPGIRNIAGAKMKASSNWRLTFEQHKPEIKLTGNGVIMPHSEALTFPFEAVGLNAIEVEIFKIYNNNILQFLQSNDLGGTRSLQQVGRLILQKKVSLDELNPGADFSSWSSYALDLSQLIEQDPSAIYEVRLGFRPEYSTYTCGGSQSQNTEVVEITNRFDEDGEIKSIFDDYYGVRGHFDGFSWENRDNPCFPEFYHSGNFTRRNIFASNLGITAKKGQEGDVFVAVADLRTSNKLSGTTVEFYDYQQQLIKTMQTDTEGMLMTQLDKTPFVIIAKNGNETGYLKLHDGGSLSLSKFEVAGQRLQKGVKGFLYGERGVWRPGDSLFLNFVLEDATGKLPKSHPISFELRDARGQLQEKFAVTENVNGIYPIRIATSSEAPTGNWLASTSVGGAKFTKTLKIETVKPNRLKVNLDFGKDKLLHTDRNLLGDLQVNWLHGAPAKGLKAKIEMQLEETPLSFDKYSDYEFSDPARNFGTVSKVVFDKNLDNNGNGKLDITISDVKNSSGLMRVNFKARAFEKGGDFSANSFSIPFYPFESNVGVRLPRNRWGHERMTAGEENTMNFVALDHDGNPLKNRQLNIGIYRVNWRWWYERDRNKAAKFNSTNHIEAYKKQEITTNTKGEAQWSLELASRGRFMVRVCDQVSGHCSGRYFYNGYPYYRDSDDDHARKEATMLAFASDKDVYQVGDVAKINVPSGESGRILLTLESGSKVLESYWRDASSGDNEIRFNITQDMLPNVYAHVSLVQPHAQTQNDLPIRMYGVIPVKVEDKRTQLSPTIAMPDVLEPEQEVTIQIAEKDGKDMAYTIAVVDDGLLDLTNFKTPNPHDVFYAKEALGVKTWDVYDEVLGAYGGELERILAVGGDAARKAKAPDQKANRFKPVVRHVGPFYLPKGEKKSHKIKMPNYVGSVRTMVVAAKDGAYGAADKTTPVRKPVMLLATLPRVLSPGEKLRVPVNVFAMEKKVKNVNVKIAESSGIVKLLGDKSQSLKFSQPGDDMTYFDIEVGQQVGVAKFAFNASGAGETASQEIEIQVRNPNPFQSKSLAQMVVAGDSWETTFEPVGVPGTNTGVLEVTNIPPLDLERRLKYLIRYPYGCVEQTTSSVFPQLYVDYFMDLDESQKEEIAYNIREGIDRLRSFQTSTGGFSYWPGRNDYVNSWGSSYAGHFLVEAKNKGYAVPSNILENWIAFQKKAVELWSATSNESGYYPLGGSEVAQAYRLYTLAVANEPKLGAMNRLRGMEKLDNRARWLLASAYALSGKKEVARKLIKQLPVNVKPYRDLSYNFGSQARDRAIILETLVTIGDQQAAADLLLTISKDMSASRWMSTQEIAYTLLAAGKFVGKSSQSEDLKFAYQIGNNSLKNQGSSKPIFQKEINVDELGAKKLMVKNPSQAPIFVTLTLSGKPAIGLEKDEQSKLDLSVNYASTDGKSIDPSRIPQGTDFYATVTVKHPGVYANNLKELALEQVFPAGWEIINSRMDELKEKKENSPSKYRDFRDDRVNTFFDLNRRGTATYHVLLNAAYQGKYYHPAVNCEAMYDNSIYARRAGMWVEVVDAPDL